MMAKQLISSFLPLDEMATSCRIDSKYISIGRPRYHKSQMMRNMQHLFIAKTSSVKVRRNFEFWHSQTIFLENVNSFQTIYFNAVLQRELISARNEKFLQKKFTGILLILQNLPQYDFSIIRFLLVTYLCYSCTTDNSPKVMQWSFAYEYCLCTVNLNLANMNRFRKSKKSFRIVSKIV